MEQLARRLDQCGQGPVRFSSEESGCTQRAATFCRWRRAKTLLYVYRVLLTGIHLMRTGGIEANLLRLNEEFKLPYISDLIAQKTQSGERSQAPALGLAFHQAEYPQ